MSLAALTDDMVRTRAREGSASAAAEMHRRGLAPSPAQLEQMRAKQAAWKASRLDGR